MTARRITIAIIIGTGLATGACKAKAPEATDPKKPVETPAAEQTVAADEKAPEQEKAPVAEFRGPGERLLKTVGPWTLSGIPRYFGPDTLYDLINGGAEVYTAYGLKEMVTADYTAKDTPKVTITAEIYDMGVALNAFGRFSKFLQGREDPAAAAQGLPESIGGRGLFGGGAVSFWKGPYLVNLILLDESDGATLERITALGAEVLPPIAKALDDAIVGDTASPVETTLFPAPNFVQQSFLFEPTLLGLEALGPGFSAAYKDGTAAWNLFMTVEFEDGAAAGAALQKVAETFKEKHITAGVEGLRIAGMYPAGDAPANAKAAKSLKALAAPLKAPPR